MAGRLEGVEIFATGTHNGMSFGEKDLHEMVESFTTLTQKEGYRPILKLGHEDTQKYFGQKKGAPNLGVVDKIWVEAGKIKANFENVPDAVVDMIRNGRYNAVSIEMFPRLNAEGVTFSNVLTAVALLGAELPAVKGLKDLAASLFDEFDDERVTLTFGEVAMPATYSKEQLDEIVAAAVAKASDELKAEFEAKVTELEGEVASAKEAKETAEDALRTFEADAAHKEAEMLVDAAIKEGKLLPKQKDMAMAFAMNPATVKFGDDEKSSSVAFKEFIDSLPTQVNFDEQGASESKKKIAASAAEEVDIRARKFADEKKISYMEARTLVLDEDSELKQRYFEMED